MKHRYMYVSLQYCLLRMVIWDHYVVRMQVRARVDWALISPQRRQRRQGTRAAPQHEHGGMRQPHLTVVTASSSTLLTLTCPFCLLSRCRLDNQLGILIPGLAIRLSQLPTPSEQTHSDRLITGGGLGDWRWRARAGTRLTPMTCVQGGA